MDERELELIRMTRSEVLRTRYSAGLEERMRVLREKVLPPEVLKGLILMAIENGWLHNGRIRWKFLLPHIPVQPHGIEPWEVGYVALEMRPWELRDEFQDAAWWWRAYLVGGISDPTAWVLEQAAKREPGWAERVSRLIYGRVSRTTVYGMVRQCREVMRLRQERLAYWEAIRRQQRGEA